MTTDVITPAEAWEAVERLKLTVDYNATSGKWHAHGRGYMWEWGDTPLEAVTNLLARIGKAADKAAAVAQ